MVNDDFTPQEFVVLVLEAKFQLDEGQATRVMMTAHHCGVRVAAIFTKETAEAQATSATDVTRKKEYQLLFNRAGRTIEAVSCGSRSLAVGRPLSR